MTTFEDIRKLIGDLPGPDLQAQRQAQIREPRLTKPAGALGRLEHLAEWLCAWQGRHPPRVERISARVFAGNHGVARRGVSAYPAEVTAQMVANFEAGGGAINQLCRVFDVEFAILPLDIDRPTGDFTEQAAMDEDACAAAFAAGYDAVPPAIDLLCVGEMGIANTTAAAALACALCGGTAAEWTGPGTGVGAAALAKKAAVVEAAVGLHRQAGADGLELLRRLGGRELAAMAGAIVAARLQRVPVVLDGYVCTAAAAVLTALRGDALDHCQVGHVSAEPGHRRLLQHLGLRPLLDLEMRLGEGSGAVLAAALVKAAAACHAGMATFEDAKVSTGPT
jgi:nicotinate-nucleotide--dimethylbenzimidazole phosphoribosyltransferase